MLLDATGLFGCELREPIGVVERRQRAEDRLVVLAVPAQDLERDEQMRAELEKERMRLVQKMLNEKAGGAKTQAPVSKKARVLHCEEVEMSEEEAYLAN